MAKVNDTLRNQYLEIISKALVDNGEDVIRTNSGEIAIPVVDAEGNDKYVVFTIKVPTGSRDGEPYDAYSAAEEYQMRLSRQADRKAKAEAKKQKDLARRAAQKQEK